MKEPWDSFKQPNEHAAGVPKEQELVWGLGGGGKGEAECSGRGSRDAGPEGAEGVSHDYFRHKELQKDLMT